MGKWLSGKFIGDLADKPIDYYLHNSTIMQVIPGGELRMFLTTKTSHFWRGEQSTWRGHAIDIV